jgi:flagellar biosynthetic protein FlhB
VAERDANENRTEEPTPRRRQQAREEGKIARSPELAAAVVLLGGTLVLASFAGRAIGEHVVELFRTAPYWLDLEPPAVGGAVALVRNVVWRVVGAMAPFGLGLAVLALGVGLLQSRGVASSKPLRPDLSRINPAAGLRRVFGSEAAWNLVKSTFKLSVLALVTYVALRRAWPHFVELADAPPSEIVGALQSSTVRVALTVGLAFVALGLFDFGIQFFRLEKSLKMSRQEVVQEFREQEGDPQIKARIRQIARQRARQRMLAQVARADVVVTNPTHIAVALKYDLALAAAPMVIAMGERKLAERIKLIATQAGVPLVENRPLARALLATCTVGAPIPPALYVAVAEILAFVYRTRGRLPAALAGALRRPS